MSERTVERRARVALALHIANASMRRLSLRENADLVRQASRLTNDNTPLPRDLAAFLSHEEGTWALLARTILADALIALAGVRDARD